MSAPRQPACRPSGRWRRPVDCGGRPLSTHPVRSIGRATVSPRPDSSTASSRSLAPPRSALHLLRSQDTAPPAAAAPTSARALQPAARTPLPLPSPLSDPPPQARVQAPEDASLSHICTDPSRRSTPSGPLAQPTTALGLPRLPRRRLRRRPRLHPEPPSRRAQPSRLFLFKGRRIAA
jgi:hypothetical protein